MNFLFGKVLSWCYDLTDNYVIAILLFALLMQLLLCPFGIIQQRNMVKQAKMRPMEYIIRKKYAGRTDRATQQKMQNEIMELYQKEGYSPLKGCLPMLLQLIIVFPLFTVVINPLRFIAEIPKGVCENIVACFDHAGRIPDNMRSGKEVYISEEIREMLTSDAGKAELDQILTGFEADKVSVSSEEAGEALYYLITRADDIPNVTLFGQNLGQFPWQTFANWSLWFLLLIPFVNLGLTYLAQFISRKLSYQPPQQEQQQPGAGGMMNSMKIMMWGMPLMTLFFTFLTPGAVGIYWIFRTLLSMLQQFILSRIFKYPKYTEEDLKRMEKEMKDAKRGQSKRPDIVYNNGETAPYKSLHHIDDDED